MDLRASPTRDRPAQNPQPRVLSGYIALKSRFQSAASRGVFAHLALLVCLSGASLALAGLTGAPKGVVFVVDGRTTFVRTTAATVDDLLLQSGMTVGALDRVSPRASSYLTDGHKVRFDRAKKVRLRTGDDSMVEFITTANTVEDALKDAGVRLGLQDRVHPSRKSPLRSANTVTVTPVFHKLSLKKMSVGFKTLRRRTALLPAGAVMVQAGRKGTVLRLRDVVYEGDRPVRTTFVTDRVLVSAVNKNVLVGTGGLVGAGMKKRPVLRIFQSKRSVREVVLYMEATAYSPGGENGYSTTMGVPARWGIVAVDPRVIPLGTRVYVEGYGSAIAADTGGAIKGNRIDLCMESETRVRAFGRRTVRVRIRP